MKESDSSDKKQVLNENCLTPSNNDNSETVSKSKEKKVCYFFLSRNKCRYGVQCKFAHTTQVTFDSNGDQTNFTSSYKTDVCNENVLTGDAIYETNVTFKNGQLDKHVCKFYKRSGRCKFGKGCRFLHGQITKIKQFEIEENDAKSVQSESVDQTDRFPQNKHGWKPSKCKYFAFGNCAYGDKCKFEHDNSTLLYEKEVRADPKVESQTKVPNKKKDNVSYKSKSKRRKCKYFLAGNCTFGNKCRFWHPVDTLEPDVEENLSREESLEQSSENRVRQKTFQARRYKVSTKPTEFDITNLTEEEVDRIYKVEISQFQKRYPKATMKEEGCYQFTFHPSDPDWPYDVKTLGLEVKVPTGYPKKCLSIAVPSEINDNLPETLQRLIWKSAQTWIKDRFDNFFSKNRVELVFRPFLKWLDKHLEELFTEGLKQVQRDMMAKEAGIEFVPASQLQDRHEITSDVDETEDQESDQEKPSEAANIETTELDEVAPEVRDKSATTLSGYNQMPNKGTEVKLLNLKLIENIATVAATKIMVVVQCARCKNRTEVVSPVNRLNTLECPRCHESQLLTFRPFIAHEFSSVIGFMDVNGCRPFDLILAECHFNIVCMNCDNEMKLEGFPPGQPKETWCHHCHVKIRIAAECARFVEHQPSDQLDASKAHAIEVKKIKKVTKDPAIQIGRPLPDNGTCKHYKKSFRWLRFPCCGQTYPCDLCHDENETTHDMKFANRMICGFCAREQPYAVDKPCIACLSNMTKKSSTHWEGGKGCRDKIKMSRDDPKKYANASKTISKKAQEKQPAKKSLKLRHV